MLARSSVFYDADSDACLPLKSFPEFIHVANFTETVHTEHDVPASINQAAAGAARSATRAAWASAFATAIAAVGALAGVWIADRQAKISEREATENAHRGHLAHGIDGSKG